MEKRLIGYKNELSCSHYAIYYTTTHHLYGVKKLMNPGILILLQKTITFQNKFMI